ncbi:MAG: type II secretion system protein GspL [Pseudomonadota bacterium]
MARWIVQVNAAWPDAPLLHWYRVDERGRVERFVAEDAPPAGVAQAAGVTLWLPAGRVLLGTVKLPTRAPKQVRAILPFVVEDQLASDPEQVHVALGPQLSDGSSVVAVVDKSWFARLLEQLAAWGIRPRVALPEQLVLPLRSGAWTVYWEGREGWLRTAPALAQALDVGDAAQPPMALDFALREAREREAAPDSIDLYAAPGAPVPDVARWSERLGLPVRYQGTEALQRAAAAAEPAAVNLLQGAFAPAGAMSGWWSKLKPVAVLLALIIVVQLAGTVAEWWKLKREAAQLRAHMEQTFRQAFPEAQVVVDPPLQMERQLASLRQRAGIAAPGDFLVLLSRAAPALGSAPGVKVQGLRYQNETLELDLHAPAAEAVQGLLPALRANALRVDAPVLNPAAGGVDARVSVQGDRT